MSNPSNIPTHMSFDTNGIKVALAEFRGPSQHDGTPLVVMHFSDGQGNELLRYGLTLEALQRFRGWLEQAEEKMVEKYNL